MAKAKANKGQLQLMTIPDLKKDAYTVQTGTVPKEFTRPVKVNDFTTNIKAVLKLNHKKNSYEVNSRILWSQVSENRDVMVAVFQAKFAIEMIAIEAGEKWRKERIEAEEDSDENQTKIEEALAATGGELGMGFGDGDEEHGVPIANGND
jgi:hypothetical protein